MPTACENIGPAERRKRVGVAIGAFAVAAVIAIGVLGVDAERAWRLLALPPIWVGTLALLEAQMRTCVVLAARGVRNMDAGDERVTDSSERRALMARSWSIHVWTLLLTVLLTAALLLMPD